MFSSLCVSAGWSVSLQAQTTRPSKRRERSGARSVKTPHTKTHCSLPLLSNHSIFPVTPHTSSPSCRPLPVPGGGRRVLGLEVGFHGVVYRVVRVASTGHNDVERDMSTEQPEPYSFQIPENKNDQTVLRGQYDVNSVSDSGESSFRETKTH